MQHALERAIVDALAATIRAPVEAEALACQHPGPQANAAGRDREIRKYRVGGRVGAAALHPEESGRYGYESRISPLWVNIPKRR